MTRLYYFIISPQLTHLGNIYIADMGNNCVRKVTTSTGIITTFAGTGTASYSGDGSAASSAGLNGPLGVGVDSSGILHYHFRFTAHYLPSPHCRQRVHRGYFQLCYPQGGGVNGYNYYYCGHWCGYLQRRRRSSHCSCIERSTRSRCRLIRYGASNRYRDLLTC